MLKERVEKLSENEYLVCVKEPAERNKANIRLTNLLARYFKVLPKNIRIKNPTSRKKIVEINHINIY